MPQGQPFSGQVCSPRWLLSDMTLCYRPVPDLPLTVVFCVFPQMNCWQRRRGTRTSVTSWIRPSPSWQGTEVPAASGISAPAPVAPLLFILQNKSHCKFVYQNGKSLYNSSLLPVYFGVRVWSDELTKTSKKIYEFFLKFLIFFLLIPVVFFVQREVCIERASFVPAKSCFGYYLDYHSPSRYCFSAGK